MWIEPLALYTYKHSCHQLIMQDFMNSELQFSLTENWKASEEIYFHQGGLFCSAGVLHLPWSCLWWQQRLSGQDTNMTDESWISLTSVKTFSVVRQLTGILKCCCYWENTNSTQKHFWLVKILKFTFFTSLLSNSAVTLQIYCYCFGQLTQQGLSCGTRCGILAPTHLLYPDTQLVPLMAILRPLGGSGLHSMRSHSLHQPICWHICCQTSLGRAAASCFFGFSTDS